LFDQATAKIGINEAFFGFDDCRFAVVLGYLAILSLT
jgi:hypothetical protein